MGREQGAGGAQPDEAATEGDLSNEQQSLGQRQCRATADRQELRRAMREARLGPDRVRALTASIARDFSSEGRAAGVDFVGAMRTGVGPISEAVVAGLNDAKVEIVLPFQPRSQRLEIENSVSRSSAPQPRSYELFGQTPASAEETAVPTRLDVVQQLKELDAPARVVQAFLARDEAQEARIQRLSQELATGAPRPASEQTGQLTIVLSSPRHERAVERHVITEGAAAGVAQERLQQLDDHQLEELARAAGREREARKRAADRDAYNAYKKAYNRLWRMERKLAAAIDAGNTEQAHELQRELAALPDPEQFRPSRRRSASDAPPR
jgi:hypothetical protein